MKLNLSAVKKGETKEEFKKRVIANFRKKGLITDDAPPPLDSPSEHLDQKENS